MGTLQLDFFLGENGTETQKCLCTHFQEPESTSDCLFVCSHNFFFSFFNPSFFFYFVKDSLQRYKNSLLLCAFSSPLRYEQTENNITMVVKCS